MKILYGTTNPAKLLSMQRITQPLDIQMIGLKELGKPLPEIDESGSDPLENAKIKARAYYAAFSMPVFSCDSGLYFDGLEDALQPGVHTRRIGGKELTDEEMTAYYADLARRHNGRLIGRYRNAICLIVNETTCFSSMDESLTTEPFMLVSTPHPKRVKGFPLDSLSIDLKSGKYFYDMEYTVDQSAIEQGFYAFFAKALAAMKGESYDSIG